MNTYLIKRDGKTIGITRGNDAMGPLAWFHQNVNAYSMQHAIEHEGFSSEQVETVDCRDVCGLIEAICSRAGVKMKAAFVPFSQSRHAKPRKGEKPWRSLNWRATIQHVARDVLETDYAQGEGHAPSHNEKNKHERQRRVSYELETGRRANQRLSGGKPIDPPRLGDVMQSLARDSDVIDYASFEDWAESLGYDSDSREAEKTYRACLDIATRLRAGLGAALIDELRIAAEYN